MADLLPSLSSDEEDGNDIEVTKKGNKVDRKVDIDDNDSDDDDSDDDMELEFGGILGEDRDGSGGFGFAGASSSGWSYQTALDRLEAQQSNSSVATNGISGPPPRMDVASIIAAKRKSIKKGTSSAIKQQQANEVEEDDEEDHSSDDEEEEQEIVNKSSSDDDDDDSAEEEGNDNEKAKNAVPDSHSSDTNSTDSDDSDSDDSDVDDVDADMERDVLKTKIGDTDGEDPTEDDMDEDPAVDDEGNADSDTASQSSSDEEDEEDREEARKAAKFFDTHEGQSASDEIEVFAQLTLSRPLLRGIASMGYVKPTKIQSSVIPVALAGRDICASAVTGSGKTASFLLPVLERLLYRSPGRIKALILTPTRELAAQCLGMMSTLSQFTKITSALVVGGSKNMNAQMAELRARPQVVVATPGRLLDHITNSAGVSLEDVEFLILDEADRLLDLGFQDEVNEIVKACPVNRQTLLFSATMNTKVDDLINLSLKRPVRVRVSDKSDKSSKDLEVAPRLEQEFIRIRSGNEGVNREAMLLSLLTRTFKTQSIVFFDTKAKAHRMMILCGLCGIKCAELHGNLTQAQRLEALENFRKGEVDILLATDLAARGLDISRVEAVVNYEMPTNIDTYVHRIGRTARAGRGGRSCTLIGEGRRHLMKDIIKDASDRKRMSNSNANSGKDGRDAVIRSRSIPPSVVSHFVKKIKSLEQHVEDVLQAEAVARIDRLAEMEAMKAQNIIEHADEIKSRPQRQWFVSEQGKKMTKEAAAEKARLIKEKIGTGTHRMTRKKRRMREAKEMFEADGDGDDEVPRPKAPSMKKSARDQKREAEDRERSKNSRSIHDEDVERAARSKKKKSKTGSSALGDGSLFSDELVAYAPKKKVKSAGDEREKSAYHFRGYDPLKDGRKKNKKKAHHKFKSKSKYKRR